MKLREFEEGIKKLGAVVKNGAFTYDVFGKESAFASVDRYSKYAFAVRDASKTNVPDWSKEKQEELIRLCTEFALTELEDR